MLPSSVGRGWWRIATVGLVFLAAFPAAAQESPQTRPKLDVPYVPTEQNVVQAMLKLGGVTEKDFVIDLGCGDGRIVVAAAKTFKAHAYGIDIDPQRISECKENAEKAGVTDMVKFELGDLMKADLRPASVLTMFLLESVNMKLRPKVIAELKPGSRVVSHAFTMGDWKADREIHPRRAFGGSVYLWIVPAGVGGTWRWKTKTAAGDAEAILKVEQNFQSIRGTLALGGSAPVPIVDATTSGKDIRFAAAPRVGEAEAKIAFEGTVEDGTIQGTQQWLSGGPTGKQDWTAKRDPVDIAGRWQVRSADHPAADGTLTIQRKDNRLTAAYARQAEPGTQTELHHFYVWGAAVRFEVPAGGSSWVFCGTLNDQGGEGTVTGSAIGKDAKWSAKRIAEKAEK